MFSEIFRKSRNLGTKIKFQETSKKCQYQEVSEIYSYMNFQAKILHLTETDTMYALT